MKRNKHNSYGISFEGVDSLTHQHFKDDCDINFLMKRFRDPDTLCRYYPAHADTRLEYVDLVDAPTDLHDAFSRVKEAESAFNDLPLAIRSRFNHDPQQLVSFLLDPNNNDESVRLGLREEGTVVPPCQPAESSVTSDGSTDKQVT